MTIIIKNGTWLANLPISLIAHIHTTVELIQFKFKLLIYFGDFGMAWVEQSIVMHQCLWSSSHFLKGGEKYVKLSPEKT